ncbi:MAG: capsular biosynthesis protein [Sphingorhabdus sp.]|nr:capsular biosynthesis protein [Sphingorhabdus sp.]
MSKHDPIRRQPSLLERAAEVYDFGAALRRPEGAPLASPQAEPERESEASQSFAPQPQRPAPQPVPIRETMAPAPRQPGFHVAIDRARLRENNLIVPEAAVGMLVEEFRIVKRQLLLSATGGKGVEASPHGRRILVCSANPDEGKTFCAINLALALANERDNRVLLVDADFARPSILPTLGIQDGEEEGETLPGLMDALADPARDVESLILGTDIPGFTLLPSGMRSKSDTEYLASHRTETVFQRLEAADPHRIVIFDSPPALAASPASVLALHAGQVLLVVKADETSEAALRDAIGLLSGCDDIKLLLNGTQFSPTGRKFGSYYGNGGQK